MKMKKKTRTAIAAALLAAACAASTPPGIVAETPLADGSTNAWTQADLVDALGLVNRRYRRDIETESGRRAWHGRLSAQAVATNAAGRLVMRLTYEDGWTWEQAAKPPSPIAAARAALNRRALLPTNGVSPRLAARRIATAAAPVAAVTNVTVTVGRPAPAAAAVEDVP